MKKRAIIGMMVALGLFVGSSAYAAGCGGCGDNGKCKDPQAVQQFKGETASLAAELKAKDLELRNEYAMAGIDITRTGELESEIKELKARIQAVAEKHGMPACCTV
jgi:hypothetical protein